MFLVSLFALVAGSFFVFSAPAFGQATGAPGEDEDATNIANLLRIEDPDGSGKQIKAGKLRVGSATTIDISNTFEVLGDLHVQGSFLISTAGSCPTTACQFAVDGQQYPTFLAQPTDDFVGIGTNNPTGRFVVLSRVSEGLQNGAIYATSSVDHGAYGVSTAPGYAGVHAVATDFNMYGIFGKSVDKENRGVSGIVPDAIQATAPAGLFYGNVLITGGYLQGNASKLYRVASLNDDSIPGNEGGRGVGVWTTNTEITVNASSTENLEIDIKAGEDIRSLQYMVRKHNAGLDPEPWKAYIPGGDLAISLVGHTLSIENTSLDTYNVRVTAHIETGVSIVVKHKVSEIVNEDVLTEQPLLFEPNALYELHAEVSSGLAQSFKWEFTTGTPRGQICEKVSEGVAGTCVKATGSITGQAVYYKMPATYSQTAATDTMQVEWLGGIGDITRPITMQLVEIVTPTNLAVEWNAGAPGASPAVDVSATSVKVPESFGTPVELYSLVETRPGASIDLSSGIYVAPNIDLNDSVALGTLGVEEQVKLQILGTNIEKTYSVWLVPSITLDLTFPNDLGTDLDDSQVGNQTNTVAIGYPLTVSRSISSNPHGTDLTMSCTHPSGSCTYTEDPSLQVTASLLGANTLTATWVPAGSSPYPAGLSHSVSEVFYAGRIYKSPASDGAVSRWVEFYVEGYPVKTLSISEPLNNLTYNDAGSSNQEIGKSTSLSASSLQQFDLGGSGVTRLYVSASSDGTYQVKGRTNQDLREVATAVVTRSTSEPCTGCSTSKPPPCCGSTSNVIVGGS